MNDLGFFQENVYGSNSVDSPTDKMFIVISSEGASKAFGTTGVDLVTYWVHQKKILGIDYATVDLALFRLRELLVGAQHFQGGDGWSLTGASWVDQSRDLADEAFQTITKFTTFRVASRNIVTT